MCYNKEFFFRLNTTFDNFNCNKQYCFILQTFWFHFFKLVEKNTVHIVFFFNQTLVPKKYNIKKYHPIITGLVHEASTCDKPLSCYR